MAVLESVGRSPAASTERIRLITGSGYLIVPKVQVPWLQCLGQKIDYLGVVAHTLPIGSVVDGLLGMDVLRPLRATLAIGEDVIDVLS